MDSYPFKMRQNSDGIHRFIASFGMHLIVSMAGGRTTVQPPTFGQYSKTSFIKARNLLERMRDYQDDILRFAYNFKVPFDNNFSERDIRMMKLKQKISGCFRSKKGAQYFARIRSYIMTARKQSHNVFEALTNLFVDNTLYPKLLSA